MDNILIIIAIIVAALFSALVTYFILRAIYSKTTGKLQTLKMEVLQADKRLTEKKNEIKDLNINFDNNRNNLIEKLADLQIEFNEKQQDINAKFKQLGEDEEIIQAKKRKIFASFADAESKLTEKIKDLATIEERYGHLVYLEANANSIELRLKQDQVRHESLQYEIQELENYLQDLKSELDIYSRIEDYVGYGIYEEPKYLHETPERYQAEIKRVREKQKLLIKNNEAVELPSDIRIEGSSKTGNAVLNGQSKLMLRAFNIECDFLMEGLNPSNFDRTLDRIQKVAEELEKNTISLAAGITTDYIELKFEECRLLFEYKLKKAEQDEEQRLIREQIREEQRVIKEYERAITEAEKEERLYSNMLLKVQEKIRGAHEEEKKELEGQIQYLEVLLKAAQEKEQRAKSMAEQTRKGHVYVISNIGSFGEHVYKIGLTRRLEPLDRVNELSDASVPFRFDVHAIIYSDDAPALETSLHKRFSHARLNVVNRRKEFFKVSLNEIKKAVDEIANDDMDFVMTATAEEYYETLRLQGTDANEVVLPSHRMQT